MRALRQRLVDVRDALRAIRESVAGLDEAAFCRKFEGNREFADALSYRIAVIGEAVAAVVRDDGDGLRGRHPGVDWTGFKALRNIVVHQYFRRNSVIIFTVVNEELPVLGRAVEMELSE